jgi:hypothetical protein
MAGSSPNMCHPFLSIVGLNHWRARRVAANKGRHVRHMALKLQAKNGKTSFSRLCFFSKEAGATTHYALLCCQHSQLCIVPGMRPGPTCCRNSRLVTRLWHTPKEYVSNATGSGLFCIASASLSKRRDSSAIPTACSNCPSR